MTGIALSDPYVQCPREKVTPCLLSHYLRCERKGTKKQLKNTKENNAREEYIRLVTI